MTTLPFLPPLVQGKSPAETTVVVAMSGGVDSSCAAAWLAHEGYKVIGVTLQLWDYAPSETGEKKPGTCCALDDVYDARRVCQKIGIPHYVLNYESAFKQAVVDDFVETYLAGATPVPCVRCNQRIKFKGLLEHAKLLGADVLVTGHYVRKGAGANGKGMLLKGLDPRKDQSYFLFATTQQQLDFLNFPLGSLTKDQTRELAQHFGLHVHEKKDSQDICFVPNGDYRAVVKKFAAERMKPGHFIDEQGKVLGQHEGILGFTIGQRKGVPGGFAEPMFVLEIRPETGDVVLGPRSSLGRRFFTVNEVNWLEDVEQVAAGPVMVKVRYAHAGALARVIPLSEGRAAVVLARAEDQVAPGQAAVFYAEDRLLGGGWIEPASCWQEAAVHAQEIPESTSAHPSMSVRIEHL